MPMITIKSTSELRQQMLDGVAPKAVSSIKITRTAADDFELKFYHGPKVLAELPHDVCITVGNTLTIAGLDISLFKLEGV